ncbi:MAG: nucleotidyltransferase domain-containing protein [Planctomycetota bacterium]|jgi:predicted nucleotidyltransferase
MTIEPTLEDFKENLKGLYGERLKDVILYGSWARGKATEDSDIDLAVVLTGPVVAGREIDRMIDIITEINLKYGTLISVYPVSEKDYNSVNSPWLLNIRRDGVLA